MYLKQWRNEANLSTGVSSSHFSVLYRFILLRMESQFLELQASRDLNSPGEDPVHFFEMKAVILAFQTCQDADEEKVTAISECLRIKS